MGQAIERLFPNLGNYNAQAYPPSGMTSILIFIVNSTVFILLIIGMLAAYFERRWKWFFPILVCVILSGLGVFLELSQWFFPGGSDQLPTLPRAPFSPL